jgi:signal transduction histidine kinase
MQPAADVRPAAVAARVVEIASVKRLTALPGDAPSCDARIPISVSKAFRRAVGRLKAEKEFSAASDLPSTEAHQALERVSDAVQQAYVQGRCGSVTSGPVALHALNRLRQAFVEEIDALRTSLKQGELPQALRAFDLVRDEIDRDETERFASALRSVDGLDLVVEVAHDMRSPLTAVLMLSQMARHAQAETPCGGAGGAGGAARQLGLVYSAAFGLNALVNDVITLARGGDREMDRECVSFSMSALISSVADTLRPIAEERRLALTVTTPPVDGRVGQPIALSRVLLNLASNALKYTEAGEVTISAADRGPTCVHFEVTDTGPGIPPDVMQTLFEPFSRRSSGTRIRRFSKTGLGLAICRKFLRQLGSELQVESSASMGTRFFFDLSLPATGDDGTSHRPSGALLL